MSRRRLAVRQEGEQRRVRGDVGHGGVDLVVGERVAGPAVGGQRAGAEADDGDVTGRSVLARREHVTDGTVRVVVAQRRAGVGGVLEAVGRGPVGQDVAALVVGRRPGARRRRCARRAGWGSARSRPTPAARRRWRAAKVRGERTSTYAAAPTRARNSTGTRAAAGIDGVPGGPKPRTRPAASSVPTATARASRRRTAAFVAGRRATARPRASGYSRIDVKTTGATSAPAMPPRTPPSEIHR